MEVSAFRFVCLPKDALDVVRAQGLVLDGRAVHARLGAARRARRPGECVLVARAAAFGGRGWLPPEAFANLTPYRKPRRIRAAGGLVVREGGAEPEVLLIHRRGVWDLPKGKRDTGESKAACALREVREELGIAQLVLLGPAGRTVHGYPEVERYVVKVTRWFFMATAETAFAPEASEGIDAVAWLPWTEATRRVGYDTLRGLLERLGPERARAALQRAEAGA